MQSYENIFKNNLLDVKYLSPDAKYLFPDAVSLSHVVKISKIYQTPNFSLCVSSKSIVRRQILESTRLATVRDFVATGYFLTDSFGYSDNFHYLCRVKTGKVQ